jgi:hypothetical protein
VASTCRRWASRSAGASLVAALVQNALAWPLVGFLATSLYLVVIAAQFTIADANRQ